MSEQSDTPRTDAAHDLDVDHRECVAVEFTRQLERELAGANAIYERAHMLEAKVAEQQRTIEALQKDAGRIDLLEKNFFESHWDGTIGRPPAWRLVCHYRYITTKMIGLTLREAIDEAMKK